MPIDLGWGRGGIQQSQPPEDTMKRDEIVLRIKDEPEPSPSPHVAWCKEAERWKPIFSNCIAMRWKSAKSVSG
jgi:hypothetical protein